MNEKRVAAHMENQEWMDIGDKSHNEEINKRTKRERNKQQQYRSVKLFTQPALHYKHKQHNDG